MQLKLAEYIWLTGPGKLFPFNKRSSYQKKNNKGWKTYWLKKKTGYFDLVFNLNQKKNAKLKLFKLEAKGLWWAAKTILTDVEKFV